MVIFQFAILVYQRVDLKNIGMIPKKLGLIQNQNLTGFSNKNVAWYPPLWHFRMGTQKVNNKTWTMGGLSWSLGWSSPESPVLWIPDSNHGEPWCWNTHTYIYSIFLAQFCRCAYSSTMEHLGIVKPSNLSIPKFWSCLWHWVDRKGERWLFVVHKPSIQTLLFEESHLEGVHDIPLYSHGSWCYTDNSFG